MAPQISYSVFDEFFDPLVSSITPEVADKLLATHISPQYQAHISQLAEKANEGLLTPEEQAEYRCIVEIADVVAILKLKIRNAFGQ
jgi:hypothetical protein